MDGTPAAVRWFVIFYFLAIQIVALTIVFIKNRHRHKWVVHDSFKINYKDGVSKQLYVLRCEQCGKMKKREF